MPGFLGVPAGAAYHLVFALTQLLTPLAGGFAAALAIVVFTAAARLAVSPLSLHALRGQAAAARLAPQVRALQRRHGSDPGRLSRELTALYREEGTSPLAGCWPLLAQWPVLGVLYLLFRSGTVDGVRNQLLTSSLFGVPLGSHWLAGSLLSLHALVFLAVFGLLAALCGWSARLAARARPSASGAANVPDAAGPSGAAALVTRAAPYLTVVIAAFAPLAAAVYLCVTVAWTLAEQSWFRHRATRRRAPGAQSPPEQLAVTSPGG